VRFECDKEKNRANIKKHGISFYDVIAMFNHPMIVHLDTRNDYEENRWLGVGLLKNHVGVVIYTERSGDVIRIISARKANKREVNYYAKNI